MEIRYWNHPPLHNGVFMTPQDTASPPTIRFCYRPGTWYTLILFDPDAVGGNKIHAMVVNISCDRSTCKGDTVVGYEGPHPPEGSGIHRYIFWLLEQGDYTSTKIQHVKTRFQPVDEVLRLIPTRLKKVGELYFYSEYARKTETWSPVRATNYPGV
jgi:hypothetical protein